MNRFPKLLFFVASIGTVLFFQPFLSGSSEYANIEVGNDEEQRKKIELGYDKISERFRRHSTRMWAISETIRSLSSQQDVRDIQAELEVANRYLDETKKQISKLKSDADRSGADLEAILGARYSLLHLYAFYHSYEQGILSVWIHNRASEINKKSNSTNNQDNADQPQWLKQVKALNDKIKSESYEYDALKMEYENQVRLRGEMPSVMLCVFGAFFACAIRHEKKENPHCEVYPVHFWAEDDPYAPKLVNLSYLYEVDCPEFSRPLVPRGQGQPTDWTYEYLIAQAKFSCGRIDSDIFDMFINDMPSVLSVIGASPKQ